MATKEYNSLSNLGWLHSPIIDRLTNDQWQVKSWLISGYESVDEVAYAWKHEPPTFAWLKDGELHALYVPSIDFEAFKASLGISLDITRGYEVVAKRWTRALRPVGFACFGQPRIELNGNDYRLTDGRVYIRQGYILDNMMDWLPSQIKHPRRVEEMLERSTLGEICVLNKHGEIKGDCEVLPDDKMPGVDIIVGRNKSGEADYKPDLKADFGDDSMVTFVSLHNSDEADIDMQTLVNLTEPFGPLSVDMLLEWLEADAMENLLAIRSGEAFRKMGKLSSIDSYDVLDHQIRVGMGTAGMWPLKRIAVGSGGAMEFPRLRRQIGDMWIAELNRDKKFRVRNKAGGRYYLTPTWRVPKGCCKIDKRRGLLVNMMDQLSLDPAIDSTEKYNAATLKPIVECAELADVMKPKPGILEICGGADLDDAFNIIVVRHAGELWAICTRCPMGPSSVGPYCIEAVTLKVIGEIPEKWQKYIRDVDLDKMPKGNIDIGKPATVCPVRQWYDANAMELKTESEYSFDGVLAAARRHPVGVLGSMANLLMVFTGTVGQQIPYMPMGISDISDWSHGKFAVSEQDTKSVRVFIKNTFQAVADGIAVPGMLIGKFPGMIQGSVTENRDITHPMNRLWAGVQRIRSKFSQALDMVCLEVEPPKLPHDDHYLAEATELLSINASFWSAKSLEMTLNDDHEVTDEAIVPLKEAIETALAKYGEQERPFVMLSLAHVIYSKGITITDDRMKYRDSVLWTPGIRRHMSGRLANQGDPNEECFRSPGLADIFTDALVASGAIRSVKMQDFDVALVEERTLDAPKRKSIAVNGLRYTIGPMLAEMYESEFGNKPDEDTLIALIAAFVGMERERFQNGKTTQIFPRGEIGLAQTNLQDHERLGVFNGEVRLGVLPANNGYASCLEAGKMYKVLDFWWTGSQFAVVVAV